MTIDPSTTFGLPSEPSPGQPVTAETFRVLLEAARRAGWPGVYRIFAEGETVPEQRGKYVIHRAARRRTLMRFLEARPDLRALLDAAAQERRDRLLTQLESEVERIALGPGDVTNDFNKQGQITRTKVDTRQKLYAILQLLKAHDPDQYADRKKIDVGGRVGVDHVHTLGESPTTYRLSAEDVIKLPEAQAAALFSLLEVIEQNRQQEKENRRVVINQPSKQPCLPPPVEEVQGPLDP